jgi:hypothetical protein
MYSKIVRQKKYTARAHSIRRSTARMPACKSPPTQHEAPRYRRGRRNNRRVDEMAPSMHRRCMSAAVTRRDGTRTKWPRPPIYAITKPKRVPPYRGIYSRPPGMHISASAQKRRTRKFVAGPAAGPKLAGRGVRKK